MTTERLPPSIEAAFVEQARICAAMSSPLTEQAIRCFASVTNRTTTFETRVHDWTGCPDAMHDALPLRVAAALHGLARSGRDAGLSSLYRAGQSAADAVFGAALREALSHHDAWLQAWLDHPPQTNEVARSACLYLGLRRITERSGLPIHLREIGSSAGLNLNLDLYRYDFGGFLAGDPSSPLLLEPQWSGEAGAGPDPVVLDRRGCDLSPINPADPAQRARLLSYFWPDQPERLDRATTALDIWRRHPTTVEQSSADDWVRRNVGLSGRGAATVLMHSATWTYIPDAAQAAIKRHMEATGDIATAEAPLAWLTFELDADARSSLRLRYWPGGTCEVLAKADPHCRRIEWMHRFA